MKVVVVGGGNAGMQVADSLRREGFEGAIDILCEENQLPYQRPPLSKKFLEGAVAEDRLNLRPESYYEKKDINLHLGVAAKKIDRETKRIETADGQQFDYDKLVLATGARIREMQGTSAEDKLIYIRTVDDVKRLQARLTSGMKIVIVGGGFIGLETAATLTTLGHSVTVLEAMPNIMPGLVAPELGSFFKDKHASKGVNILEGIRVEGIAKSEEGYAVSLAGGEALSADLVIVGIGVIPNMELAQDARLDVDRGISANAYMQTSDPDIYAVGDCAHAVHARFGEPTRLESVQNAVDQATTAAKSIVGTMVDYDALPWFWSDQYDLKLQMAGLSRGYDELIVRGDMASEKFSLCYIKDNALIAVDSVNMVADHMAARRLLTSKIDVTPQQCADASTPLKTYLS